MKSFLFPTHILLLASSSEPTNLAATGCLESCDRGHAHGVNGYKSGRGHDHRTQTAYTIFKLHIHRFCEHRTHVGAMLNSPTKRRRRQTSTHQSRKSSIKATHPTPANIMGAKSHSNPTFSHNSFSERCLMKFHLTRRASFPAVSSLRAGDPRMCAKAASTFHWSARLSHSLSPSPADDNAT